MSKAKSKMKLEVIAHNPTTEWIKEQIEKAGNTIGSVHFKKRSNNELRKMCYRLHVQKPSVAKIPKGLDSTEVETKTITICECGESSCEIGPFIEKKVPIAPIAKKAKVIDKKKVDKKNNQMTVLDTNKVVRDKSGKKIGRGDWRTIPLERVERISNCGVTYTIKYDALV